MDRDVEVTFLVVSLFYLLVPGTLIRYLWARPGKSLIFVPAWSWIYLTLVFLLSRSVSSDVTVLAVTVHGGILLLAGGAVAKWTRTPRSAPVARHGDVMGGVIAVVLIYSVYFLWAGPYIEIPADVYRHIGYLQWAMEPMDDGELIHPNEPLGLLTKAAQHWYVIFAYIALQSGTTIEDAYPYIAYINSVLLIIGIYVLALYVFAPIRESRGVKIGMALATVVFFCLHFGVNVFAYIRYYAIAPTTTAYLIYASSIIVVLEMYKGRIRITDAVVYVTGCLIATGLLHIQEMIFILVMTWSMAVIYVLQTGVHRDIATIPVGANMPLFSWRLAGSNPAWVIVMLGLIAFGGGVVLSHSVVERTAISGPWIAPLSDFLPFVKHLYVLNPGFQFFHIMAFWGYLMYLLLIIYIRQFRNNLFVLAGMAVPLITVLNPVFVDVYLRYEQQGTLWRMLYMVPFAFVGGYFLVMFLKAGCEMKSVYQKTVNFLMVGVLVSTLLPFDILYAENRYSRIYTLLKTPVTNRPEHWGDMLAALSSQERSYIITDPVTGYVINALTKHKVNTYKFHRMYAIDLDKDEYVPEDFSFYAGKLLVINTRGGGESRVGRLSGHWPPNVLRTDRHYSEEFLRFVEGHSDVFPLIWRNNGIAVHRIRDT